MTLSNVRIYYRNITVLLLIETLMGLNYVTVKTKIGTNYGEKKRKKINFFVYTYILRCNFRCAAEREKWFYARTDKVRRFNFTTYTIA